MTSIQYSNVMAEEELKKARHIVSEEIDKDIREIFDKLEVSLCLS